MRKFKEYLKDVKKELKKVRWPNKTEMLKYSGAALALIVVFAIFFSLTDFIIAGVKVMVG
ncbi:MAG: preprotein translocase subunit SecE [Bacilli bacterium]